MFMLETSGSTSEVVIRCRPAWNSLEAHDFEAQDVGHRGNFTPPPGFDLMPQSGGSVRLSLNKRRFFLATDFVVSCPLATYDAA